MEDLEREKDIHRHIRDLAENRTWNLLILSSWNSTEPLDLRQKNRISIWIKGYSVDFFSLSPKLTTWLLGRH